MCGLFGGISSTLSQQEQNVIKTLGFITSLRGVDSTGLVIGHGKPKKRSYGIVKDTVVSPQFMTEGIGKQALDVNSKFLILGHCRAATVGDVSVDNAHPYKIGHIVGAHNGTMYALQHKEAGRTDSYAFYKILAEKGLQEALDATGEGAYALTWIDMQNRTFNLLRNDQRPLFIGYPYKNRATVYWSSERDMLLFSMSRERQTPEEIIELPPHELFQMSTALESGCEFKRIPARKTPKVYPTHSSTPSRMGRNTEPFEIGGERIRYVGNQRQVFNKTTNTWEDKDILNVKSARHQSSQPIPTPQAPSVPLIPGPTKTANRDGLYYKVWNTFIPIAQASLLLSRGCVLCNEKATPNMEAYFVTRQDYLCKKCSMTDRSKFLSVFYNGISSKGQLVNRENGVTTPASPAGCQASPMIH